MLDDAEPAPPGYGEDEEGGDQGRSGPREAEAGGRPADPGKLGGERGEGGERERRLHEAGDPSAERGAHQGEEPLAARHAEQGGERLRLEQDRDENELQGDQPVAPARSALDGGDDRARLGVGEHGDEAGADRGEPRRHRARRKRKRGGVFLAHRPSSAEAGREARAEAGAAVVAGAAGGAASSAASGSGGARRRVGRALASAPRAEASMR